MKGPASLSLLSVAIDIDGQTMASSVHSEPAVVAAAVGFIRTAQRPELLSEKNIFPL